MHTTEARKLGEADERLHLLNAWREATCFTARERAALSWVESVTTLADGHVPDEVFEEVRRHFSEKEAVAIKLKPDCNAFRATPKVTAVKNAL